MEISTLLFLFALFCQTLAATILKNGTAAIRVVVKEREDANLPCSLNTKESIEGTLFDWKKDDQKEVFLYDAGNHYNNGRHGQDEQFKGRVFHFQDELKHGNASIIIKNTKISDSGIYTCDFPRLPNRQTFYIELVVGAIDRDRSGEIKGAARKPYITTKATEDGVLLQCDVQDASPKPEVEWQDSAGNILPAEEPQVIKRGDRYDVTLLTTVTKSDHFRCVVKQKEINHTISAEIYMPFPGAAAEPCTKILGFAEDGLLLQCEVLDASPKPEVEWQDSTGNILRADEPQVTERGNRYDIILLTTVTKTDNFSCFVRQKEINHVTSAWTFAPVHEKRCEVWTGWLGGLVLGAAVTAVIAALLHYITISRNKGSHQQMNRFRNGSSHVPLTPNGSSHLPLTPNGSSHVPLIPNGSSHVPLIPNGSSHVPLTPNGSSHVPLIPNGSSHVPLIPNGSSRVPLIPEPHQNGDDKSNGAV